MTTRTTTADTDGRTVPEQLRAALRDSDAPELTVAELAAAADLTDHQVRTTLPNVEELVLDERVDAVHFAGDEPEFDDPAIPIAGGHQ